MKPSDKLPKFHNFNGKRYRITLRKPRGAVGTCDSPDTPNREIKVDPSLNKFERFEVLLHEALHAELWCLDEETVTRISENITDFLSKFGMVPQD